MNIPYNEIDALCVPLVRLFNEIGLETEFSCQGHDNNIRNQFYIMFSQKVSNVKIEEFLKSISDNSTHTPLVGKFVKWARKSKGELIETWVYILDYGNPEINHKFAEEDYNAICHRLLFEKEPSDD